MTGDIPHEDGISPQLPTTTSTEPALGGGVGGGFPTLPFGGFQAEPSLLGVGVSPQATFGHGAVGDEVSQFLNGFLSVGHIEATASSGQLLSIDRFFLMWLS